MSSKIKVDNINKVSDDSNIIKKCGSTTTVGSGSGQTVVLDGATITLGRCGGAVNLASGATQTGFGRTGTVNWCTTAKTGPLTVASGNGYFLNTSSGAITVTLPASPSAGDIVAFKDYSSTWDDACKSVTVARNGSKINGVEDCATLNTESQSVTLIYVDATKGWQDIHDSTASVIGGTFYNVEYLVVAGGGGANGPACYGGGGGGAGGYRNATGFQVSTNCAPYTITVGAGGSGAGTPNAATVGAVSTFSTITSAGGGQGGNAGPVGQGGSAGGDGGSGGGGVSAAGGSGNTPPVSPPQGNNGGIGALASGNVRSGGGGGAAAQGEDGPTIPTPNLGGDGGIGAPSAIFGSAPQAPTYGTPGPAPGRYFAGGGAARGGYSGNTGSAGSGGSGGGGGGATNGTTNTGGGGGGNRLSTAGSGGSGIVIIKHTTADATPSVSGGNVVLTCGSHTIRIFTGSGTFVP